MIDDTRVEQAYQELQPAIIASQSWRTIKGDYDDIDVEELTDAGYTLPGFTDGTAENVYGKDLAIASANSDADAKIDYTTDTDETCEQLLDHLKGASFIAVTPTCTA